MLQIKPVSDLRNKLPEIERIVNEGTPVFLTKNGQGAMVVMSFEDYTAMAGDIDNALLEAEAAAQNNPVRYTRDQMYGMLKERINAAR